MKDDMNNFKSLDEVLLNTSRNNIGTLSAYNGLLIVNIVRHKPCEGSVRSIVSVFLLYDVSDSRCDYIVLFFFYNLPNPLCERLPDARINEMTISSEIGILIESNFLQIFGTVKRNDIQIFVPLKSSKLKSSRKRVFRDILRPDV